MSVDIENPLVSVIIPVFNTEDYLKECLDSVLNQTLKEIEVICIDDKSTDNSLKILEKYAKKDSRLKILYNKENTGQAVARNIALKEVKGKYISFIDSDDKIDLTSYEKLIKFSKKHNQDVILFNMKRFDGKKIWDSELHTKSIIETIEKTNLLKNPEIIYDTTTCNKFVKKSFLLENNIHFIDKLYEDILFSMNLFTSTDSIGIYPDVIYYWRFRDKSKKSNKSTTQSRTDIKNIKDRMFIIKEIYNLFNSQEKYNPLINHYYEKIIKIDFLLYINQIDKGNDEYKNILISEISNILKAIPKEIFEDIKFIDKLKYEFLMNKQIDNLINIVIYEKEQKEEIERLKSTKGWFNFKINNLHKKIKK